ncbi:uncharacterized protein LOC105901549 [Clupea harengus]|uniref:Uncharacterized protein LOC105901549 n=1 Tax=Clupea harengus TaxID=7950 RepID=A0A6P3VYU5_CLUHA|nr:uncharacterized protein LOC105901549 [Clupea harengus]
MIRIPRACVAVCLFIVLLGVLPKCLGSVENVVKTSPNTGALLPNETRGMRNSEDELISYKQPQGTNHEANAKAEAAYKKYLSKWRLDNSLPVDIDVLCEEDKILVTIASDDVENVHVFAPDGLPLSLSELPAYCNILPMMVNGDVLLVSRFDGCFVRPQGSAYVLNLRWYGRPIQATCPRHEPPLIICKKRSIQVLFFGEKLEEKLSVNVKGRWLPLENARVQCRFRLHSRPGMVSLSAPYTGCGMSRENGIHTMSIQLAEKDMILSCPSDPLVDHQSAKVPSPPQTPQPTYDPSTASGALVSDTHLATSGAITAASQDSTGTSVRTASDY